jgi:hypothetical protein
MVSVDVPPSWNEQQMAVWVKITSVVVRVRCDDAARFGYPLMIAINAAVKGAGSRSPRIANCWL